MAAALSAALLFWQDANASQANDIHWIKWFVFIAAVGLALQGIGVLIAALFAVKLMKKVDHITEQVESKAMPILTKTSTVIDDLQPKIRVVTDNVQQMTYTVRAKVDEISATVDKINQTVQDVNTRTQKHVARVDGMVGEALDSTHEISRTVQHSIKTPVRQMAGVVAGLRVGLNTLVARSPFLRSKQPVGAPSQPVGSPASPIEPTTRSPYTSNPASATGSTSAASTPSSASPIKRPSPYDL